MKSRSLEFFWKEGGGKSHKSSASSSPSSKETPNQASEDPFVQRSANNVQPNPPTEEDSEQEHPNSMPRPTTPQSRPTTTCPNATYDVDLLPHDPGKRMPIESYPYNDRDAVRRGYIAKEACRPLDYNFPQREIGGGMRRFIVSWFKKYDWLEYSVERDAAYCFVCYLFKDKTTSPGGDAFVNGGFRSWTKPDRLDKHVGGLGSAHNDAVAKYKDFLNPKSSVVHGLTEHNVEYSNAYKSRLTYSLKCIRYLLQQGMAFRGHNESKDSLNKGNFLELLQWLAENSDDAEKVVLNKAPKNCQMTAPSIQKDLINCCAKETTKLIFVPIIVCVFCAKHDVEVPKMDENYVPRGRARRFYAKVTNLHRYRVEMYLSVIDLQLQELNNRFNELNMELLACMACFSPANSFASFDVKKLVRLAEFYPNEFSTNDLVALRFELELFVDDMRKDTMFEGVKDLGELSIMLVETGRHSDYKLVYLLLRLVLVLPVATASVERVFSSMTFVKNKLRNSIGDQFLNDCLVTFIERDLFLKVKNDDVINRFQHMKSRRLQI